MCSQLPESYPPPSYSRDYYNSFLPPYYPSSTGTYLTTTPAESFSSDQSAYDTQYPYANQFSQFSPDASKNLADAYTYTAPAELYTYAYLPPQPVYLDQAPLPWTGATLHPSTDTQHINPQAVTAPAPKPTSPLGNDPRTDTIKRQRYLHKNRVAATKCRSKKKQYIQQLQSRFEDLALAKRELQYQVQSLRDGLISLKEELVRHARCGDGPITSYIEKRRAGCS
ncbi:bZIP transcription factor atfD [Aspergillus udagawae]|uniref:BZIP domain-containing protein n=1 Tax=Aspergillus udagawae TaxID=91492 RepID=A0A8E0UXS5_9EURO|nr:uncharacterized protein Aud_004169 [Aspergillus udagawae]GIC87778.1 hypothetical protein Aud_004169 [Aspergillus udagawae]